MTDKDEDTPDTGLDVTPEPPAMPGDRDNPLTLEEVHREAFLNRAASAFGDDPTVATPGEDCEPVVGGPGDPDAVITLAKYGRQGEVGDAEDTGVPGGGLVAVDRETGEPIDGGTLLVPQADGTVAPADNTEDFSGLTVPELKEKAIAAGYDPADVNKLHKDELLALDY